MQLSSRNFRVTLVFTILAIGGLILIGDTHLRSNAGPPRTFEFLNAPSGIYAMPMDFQPLTKGDISAAYNQWQQGLDAHTTISSRGRILHGDMVIKFEKK